MNYFIIIHFLLLFIHQTIPLEYNDDDDDNVDQQIASQSCEYI